jgi:hypothetical protein
LLRWFVRTLFLEFQAFFPLKSYEVHQSDSFAAADTTSGWSDQQLHQPQQAGGGYEPCQSGDGVAA